MGRGSSWVNTRALPPGEEPCGVLCTPPGGSLRWRPSCPQRPPLSNVARNHPRPSLSSSLACPVSPSRSLLYWGSLGHVQEKLRALNPLPKELHLRESKRLLLPAVVPGSKLSE